MYRLNPPLIGPGSNTGIDLSPLITEYKKDNVTYDVGNPKSWQDYTGL